MLIKKNLIILCFFCCFQTMFSQKKLENKTQISPYVALSSPQSDFKNFSNSGYSLGLAIDKYLNFKFALGIDINYQTNEFKNSIDYSIIPNPFSVLSNVNGKWSSTNITFGPTYKFGNSKIYAELYTKAGISMVKSPSETATLTGGTYPSFTVFNLNEQKVTSLGVTAGLRLSYPITNKIAVFINPQYVYSSSEIKYTYKNPLNGFFPVPEGADPDFEPGLLEEDPDKKDVFKPNYFNVGAGVKISLDGNKTSKNNSEVNSNLNPSFCRLQFVKAECDVILPVMTLSSNWSGFNTGFTQAVEVYDGNTLLNPSVIPQVLSQNYGNQLFNIPVSVPVGTSLTCKLKIYDLNGNVVCESVISFLAPQCSPQPPSCDFVLDIENAICNGTTIAYNATGSWANLNPGSIIDIIAKDQSGNAINITVLPNPFPINITAANTTGSLNNPVVSIPSSYNGTPISIMIKITEPTTGYEKLCSFADFFTPICEPASTICEWEYKATCDSINKGIKIDVTSSWSNAPIGSTLRYKLINLNGGANIPFTFSPNNLPQNIVTNGSSTHTLFINSSFSGAQAVFKMEIVDANGVVLCNEGIDLKLPTCVFETCELVELEASCDNEQPFMAFSVDWSNYSNYSNYSIYLEAKDENGNPVAWFNNQTFPPFQLTGTSGSAPFSMPLFPQYAGTTITIFSKICETGTNKDCCVSILKIDIPKCCEDCAGINDIKDTTDVNQTNIVDFVITGVITQSNPTPISKVVAQLEAIKFQPINNNPLTISNFEFTRSWFANGGSQGAITTGVVGSVTGNRSNLIITEINPASATNMIFRLNVDHYNYGRDLRVEFYKVKLTIFKDDGTYCEKFITYQR